jgi:hypothetical protein
MPEVKEKVVPPSPPLHIRDNEGRAVYMRVGFLGEVRLNKCFFALQRLISGRFRKSIRGEGSTITPQGGQGHFEAICAVKEEQDKGKRASAVLCDSR